jgi:DNA-binding beta-propeller fold protein YncE
MNAAVGGCRIRLIRCLRAKESMQKPGRGKKTAAAGRSGWRRGSLAGLSTVVLVCSLAATAWAVGELTQKPGAAGCVSEGGSGGCRPGIGLAEASSVATSPDGKSVYVASAASNAVAIFNRNPDGTLEQLPGTAGCISQGGGGGCHPGIGLDTPFAVATSPEGKNVYLTCVV